MITAYIGAPGDCKTYSMTAWLLKEMRRGRVGVSQYYVEGAEKLGYLGDLLHDLRAGAAVAIDEVGRILPARDWTREDDVESVVLETHRHHGLDIRWCAQDVMQASVSLRRLTEEYIFCFRVGPDPSGRIKRKEPIHWWNLPWAVRQVTYHKDDMGSDGRPKPTAVSRRLKYIPWTKHVANSYTTTERVYTEGLNVQIQEHLLYAEGRLLESTPWNVSDLGNQATATMLNRGRDINNPKELAKIQAARARILAFGGNTVHSEEDDQWT